MAKLRGHPPELVKLADQALQELREADHNDTNLYAYFPHEQTCEYVPSSNMDRSTYEPLHDVTVDEYKALVKCGYTKDTKPPGFVRWNDDRRLFRLREISQ